MNSGLQWVQSMGVAMMANKTMLFVKLMGHDERFKAHLGELFANFDLFVTFTSCSDAYMSIPGDFIDGDRQN